MEIREIRIEDARRFVDLIKRVESESDFMLMEPGERMLTVEQQIKRIEGMKKSNNSTIFLAEKDEELIGYLIAVGGTVTRNKHSVYLVVGILQQYRGLGIGTKLFQQLDVWAIAKEIHRLELTVIKHNTSALALYRKMGFEIEGTKKHSVKIGDEFVDEFYMAKLLPTTVAGEKSLLAGMEGFFIPVKNPEVSAKWYEEILGFSMVYQEEEAAVLRIAEVSQTVVCLVKTENHQPMQFPENNFGVGKYYNFIPRDLEKTYERLVAQGVQVNQIDGEGNTRFFTFYDPDGNPLGVCGE